MYLQNVFTNDTVNIYVKQDVAFNNQNWLICHKTKANQTYCYSTLCVTVCIIRNGIDGFKSKWLFVFHFALIFFRKA